MSRISCRQGRGASSGLHPVGPRRREWTEHRRKDIAPASARGRLSSIDPAKHRKQFVAPTQRRITSRPNARLTPPCIFDKILDQTMAASVDRLDPTPLHYQVRRAILAL